MDIYFCNCVANQIPDQIHSLEDEHPALASGRLHFSSVHWEAEQKTRLSQLNLTLPRPGFLVERYDTYNSCDYVLVLFKGGGGCMHA